MKIRMFSAVEFLVPVVLLLAFVPGEAATRVARAEMDSPARWTAHAGTLLDAPQGVHAVQPPSLDVRDRPFDARRVLSLTGSESDRRVPSAIQSSAASNWRIECVDCPKQFSDMTDRSLRLDDGGHPHIAYGGKHLYYA